MTILVRRCPEGHERPLSELVCEGLLNDGNVCRFPLHDIFPVPATPDKPPRLGEPEPGPYEPGPSEPPPPRNGRADVS
jgi:hypothetical protein